MTNVVIAKHMAFLKKNNHEEAASIGLKQLCQKINWFLASIGNGNFKSVSLEFDLFIQILPID